ncbi:MAG: hypothetical protein ABIR48_04550 [Gammaproteobacteria bacterium]
MVSYVDNQLVGLDGGEGVAQDLERLASTSVDPRIPGLRIVSIPLANGKFCIAIHIPPSLSRPHMVTHTGHRSFYARHSESSFPMTTHEVREAVLTSASAEYRARQQIKTRLDEVREVLNSKPEAAFFIQAMPLIAPESAWNILEASYERVLRGNARRNQYKDYCDLASDIAPRPTIDGLLGRDQRENPNWETEVHRTGYVSVFYRGIYTADVKGVTRYVLHSDYCDLFRAFCHLLKELLDVSGTDVPYLVSCAYLKAKGTCIMTGIRANNYSEPYEKEEILWPEHVRVTGADPMTIAEDLSRELFNAFGYKDVVE